MSGDLGPDPSEGDHGKAPVGDALFAAFNDLLGSAVIRRPGVPGSSANAAVVAAANPSLRFGATAGLPEVGRPAYRFTRGTCLAFADACLHLVARPAFMPELPPAADDLRRARPGRGRTRFIDYGDCDDALLPFDGFAEGDGRLDAYDHLFAMAVRFVALHEQGHYYNGHLHAVRAANATELPEVDRAAAAAMPLGFRRAVEGCLGMDWPRASRALELQADAWAVRHLLGFGRRSDADRAPPDPATDVAAPAGVEWLRYAMLGVSCACAIFEVNDRHVTTRPSERYHPPAVQRALTAFEELGHQLPDVVAGEPAMAEFMGVLVRDLDVLFDVVGVRPFTADDFNAAFCGAGPDPPVVASWRACRQDVVDLMPHLSPFGARAAAELAGDGG